VTEFTMSSAVKVRLNLVPF